MYAVKVDFGRESLAAKQMGGCVLPEYMTENGWKRLVLPGYVFRAEATIDAVEVPEKEWKIIEALADPHMSTFNPEVKKITHGPLVGLPARKANLKRSAVMIQAVLLGVPQNYWMKVWVGTEPPAEEMLLPAVEPIRKRGKKKPEEDKPAYTEEQKQEAIRLAAEKGARAAGEELGIPWQTITWWDRKANPDRVSKRKAAEAESAESGRRRRRKAEPEEAAEAAPARRGRRKAKPEEAAEAAPVRRGRKKANPEEAAEAAPVRRSRKTLSPEQLKSENEQLREEKARLEAQAAELAKELEERVLNF